jgi:hypothetical protein
MGMEGKSPQDSHFPELPIFLSVFFRFLFFVQFFEVGVGLNPLHFQNFVCSGFVGVREYYLFTSYSHILIICIVLLQK